MLRRLLTPLLLCCALSACRNGKAHGPSVSGHKLDAAVGGEPDAQLAMNVIMTPDAAAPSVDPGSASVEAGPALQVRAPSIGLADSPAPGLHMLDQRLDGQPSTCAAVSGKQLCLQGGLSP